MATPSGGPTVELAWLFDADRAKIILAACLSCADSRFYGTLKIYNQGLLLRRSATHPEHILVMMLTSVRARSAAAALQLPTHHSGAAFGGGGTAGPRFDGVSRASDCADEKRPGIQVYTTSV